MVFIMLRLIPSIFTVFPTLFSSLIRISFSPLNIRIMVTLKSLFNLTFGHSHRPFPSPVPPHLTSPVYVSDFPVSFPMSHNFCWKLNILDNTLAILGTDLSQALLLLFAYLLGEWLDDFSEVNPYLPPNEKVSDTVSQGVQPCECPQLQWDGSDFGRVLLF